MMSFIWQKPSWRNPAGTRPGMTMASGTRRTLS